MSPVVQQEMGPCDGGEGPCGDEPCGGGNLEPLQVSAGSAPHPADIMDPAGSDRAQQHQTGPAGSDRAQQVQTGGPSRCKCNGHASECVSRGGGPLVCNCRHNTAACNCNGKSSECHFDSELYRATEGGDAAAKPGVTGDKCDRCQPGYHTLTEAGCRPCSCDPSGSTQECDVDNGRCQCKDNVEGFNCDRRRGLDGAAQGHEQRPGQLVPRRHEISLISDDYFPMYFIAPEKFLGNQLLSYGQNLSLNFRADRQAARLSAEDLVLEGAGLRVTVPLIAQGNAYPTKNVQTYVF
ncbi:hypothetical protein CRUP_018527, partial [Coryphaenoides rupestris]